jgi:hypothetical protein
MTTSLYAQTATLRRFIGSVGRTPAIVGHYVSRNGHAIQWTIAVLLAIASFPVGLLLAGFGFMVGVMGSSPAGGVHGIWSRAGGLAMMLIGVLHLVPAFKLHSKLGLTWYRRFAILLAALCIICYIPDSTFSDWRDILGVPFSFAMACFIPVVLSALVQKIKFQKEPNQTPEPTPLRVTPAAGAPVAPRSVAAHL